MKSTQEDWEFTDILKSAVPWCPLKLVPELYTYAVHSHALKSALDLFNALAHGPARQEFAAQLKSECESEWQSGRQQCEVHSLTGRPCIRALRPILSQGLSGDGGEGKLSEVSACQMECLYS